MQRVFNEKSNIWDYFLILVGTALVATSIQCIYDPISMVTGGFSGMSIIVKEITKPLIPGGIPLWFTNIALNIPVFVIAWRVKGTRFIWRTLLGTMLLSAWLYVVPTIDLPQGDYTLAAVFGGVIGGVGMGLVLSAKATTGGTDMVATLIQHYMRHYSIVQIMQVLDGLIVVVGMYVFGVHVAMYAIVAIYITTKVSDALLEGFKFSKVAYIITDRYELVAEKIMEKMDRGVTGLKAKGMYSGTDKCMLYCVVAQKQIVEVKEIVAEIDPGAFVIVTDAREVFGEGFQEHSA